MIVDTLFPMAVSPAPDDDIWYQDLSWNPLMADSNITPDTALQTTAVLACVRVLAETLAQLPLHLMRVEGRLRLQAVEHPLYGILHDEPNHWQTSFEWREMMDGHLVSGGNAYSLIKPGRRGAVDELIPLHPGPERMRVFRLDNGRLGYLYRNEKGAEFRLTQDEVFHLRGLSTDGILGLSPITLARHAVELAQASEDHGVKFYKNMAKPGGVLTLPEGKTLDSNRHQLLKKSWRDAHSKQDLFSVAILEDGMQWKQVGISNEDSQWLQSRKYQVVEICRAFRVPPHMVASAIEHSHTYSNIEHSDLAFVKYSILPWVTRWEQAISRDLIVDQAQYYAKFALEGLLRGDSRARAAYFQAMFGMGVYTINEIRELDDRNPIPGGDQHFVPGNLVPLERAGSAYGPSGDGAEASSKVQVMRRKKPPVPDDLRETVAALQSCSSHSIQSPAVFQAWIVEVARREADSDIAALEKRANKAIENRAEFDGWVREFWGGPQRNRMEIRLKPLAAAATHSEDFLQTLVAEICEETIGKLTTGDPPAILDKWKSQRADELQAILTEGLKHDD